MGALLNRRAPFLLNILEEHPGSTIVTDSVTSIGLTWWVEEQLGGVHHRFKRGYKNVINEVISVSV
jgi:phosphomannomutase